MSVDAIPEPLLPDNIDLLFGLLNLESVVTVPGH